MSEMSWMQRAREHLINDTSQFRVSAPAEYDQHAAAAQDLAYFMDDWNLLAVDEDHMDQLQWPAYQVALVLSEAYFNHAQGALQLIRRGQFFDILSQYTQPNILPDWSQRRSLAVANLVWAIGSKWLQLLDLDHNLPENHLTFYARARALGIDHRVLFDHPSIEMVQGIGLLAFYLLINGSITRARNILGHAVRHATALGLHLKVTDGGITTEEQEIRAKIWYSLYSLEVMIAEITGRPMSIQNAQITVPLDLLERNSDASSYPQSVEVQAESLRLWAQFFQATGPVSADSNAAPSELNLMVHISQDAAAQQFNLYIRLCQIGEEIALKLYICSNTSTWADVQNNVETMQGALDQWDRSLPDAMRLDHVPGRTSNECGKNSLAMYKLSLTMILHRICLCEIKIEDESERSREFNMTSARTCVQAALSMLEILPAQPDPAHMWQFYPWWTLLHYTCQALAVLLIELCLDCQHFQGRSPEVMDAVRKAMSYLSCICQKSLSAYRAWRIFAHLLTGVSWRFGGAAVFDLDQPIEHPPRWTEYDELSLSALLV